MGVYLPLANKSLYLFLFFTLLYRPSLECKSRRARACRPISLVPVCISEHMMEEIRCHIDKLFEAAGTLVVCLCYYHDYLCTAWAGRKRCGSGRRLGASERRQLVALNRKRERRWRGRIAMHGRCAHRIGTGFIFLVGSCSNEASATSDQERPRKRRRKKPPKKPCWWHGMLRFPWQEHGPLELGSRGCCSTGARST